MSAPTSPPPPASEHAPPPYWAGPPPHYAPGHPLPVRYEGLAIAGFVTSFFVPVVGLVLSLVGLSGTRRHRTRGRGLAIAGIAVSGAWFALIGLLFAVGFAGGVAGALSDSSSHGYDDSVTASDLSTEDGDYLGALYDDTRNNYIDADLLEMGHGYCTDLDTSSQGLAVGFLTAEGDLENWSGMTQDDEFDVEYEATHELCAQYADDYEAFLDGTVPAT